MKSERLKAFAVRTGEMVLALGLVLVAFLLFMGILGLSFPEGTGLGDLLRDEQALSVNGGVQLDLGGTRRMQPYVAQLTHVSRRVKDKRADAITWTASRQGLPLLDRHAVQTFDGSGAHITFEGSNEVELGENTLIIIRRMEQSLDFRERRASLVVMSGELSGTIHSTPDQDMRLELVTPGAASFIPSAEGEFAEFKLVTGDDESTTLSIYSGSAEIEAGGQRVVVPANHAVRVARDDFVPQLMRLPAIPDLRTPDDGALYVYRTAPPEVSFEWDAEEQVDSYRLSIAREAEFTDMVHEATLSEPGFTHGNLLAGRYYWRVTGRGGEVEGPASAPRKLRVERDLEPPRLDVSWPSGVFDGASYVISGVTDPGSEVFVSNQSVPVSPAGVFEYALNLQQGLNLLVVEAYDEVGNATYVSQMVRAEY